MTRDQVRATLLEALSRIAPEVGAADIDPAANLRDQIDIDSMDFLNFMILLRQTLGVDVPETDYPTLRTLDACVDYFAAKQAAPAAPAAR